MTREEERQLVIQAKAGCEESLALILKHHERALWKIARETSARGETPDDLYQTACQYFLESFATFDLSRGMRVSTYTYRFVRMRVQGRAFASGLIRLPPNARRTDAEKTDVAMRQTHQVVEDRGACARFDDRFSLIDDADERERLIVAIDKLPDRLRDYLTMLLNGIPRIMVARLWGLSRERARQLECAAIAKLQWLMGVTPTMLTEIHRRGIMRRQKRKKASGAQPCPTPHPE